MEYYSFNDDEIKTKNYFKINIGHLQKFNFILKEKKGELNNLAKNTLNEFYQLENVYVIRSENPKLLKYNSFEDLLSISDITVSLFYASQTIWQSIGKKIPVLGINYVHINSIFSKIKYFEIKPEELEDAINYWLKIDKDVWSELNNSLIKKYNFNF